MILFLHRMPRKFCVAFCKTNYDGAHKGVVYGFPKETEQQNAWRLALPNIIEAPTINMGICALHWPPDAKMYKPKQCRHEVSMHTELQT